MRINFQLHYHCRGNWEYGVLDKDNMTDHDVDVNQMNVEFSSIPMPNSDTHCF